MWLAVCQYDGKCLNVDSTPQLCVCCHWGFLPVPAEQGGLCCTVLLLQVHQSQLLARKRNCGVFTHGRTSCCGCMGATHQEEQQDYVMEEAAERFRHRPIKMGEKRKEVCWSSCLLNMISGWFENGIFLRLRSHWNATSVGVNHGKNAFV